VSTVYGSAALGVLLFHVAWLLFVVFGALVTRGRRVFTALHVAALTWALLVEAGPWPCPLTALEQALWTRADAEGYSGGFLLHYLDRLIYPGVPEWILTAGAVVVVIANVVVYLQRFWRSRT
jgi:hypothetical protein